MSIHLTHNLINRSVHLIKNCNEQTFLSFEKVQSFSKSYIASHLSKALIASVVLSCVGFSFSTAFPISLALVVFTSFMSFALDSIKEAMHALAQKSRKFLTRIAQVIRDIFKAICRFSSSFFQQTIFLKEKTSVFPKKSPLNHAVVATNTKTLMKKDAQIVRLAVSQRENPKQSEILSKFNQLSTKPPNALFLQRSYTFPPPTFSNPKKPIKIFRTTSLKSNRNIKDQESIITPSVSIPTLNLSSIRLKMRVLSLARVYKVILFYTLNVRKIYFLILL